ncbi:hypothetical protein Chor_001868 [Crotalus horridus]
MHLAGNGSRAKRVKGGDHKLGVKALLFYLCKRNLLALGSSAWTTSGSPCVGKLAVQMGCAFSSTEDAEDPAAVSEAWRGSALGLEEEGADGSRGEGEGAFPLSQAQKEWIRESWNVLHKNIARVGIIVFIGLFETHPECKDVFFLFRDVDDLQQLKMSKELQAHGLRTNTCPKRALLCSLALPRVMSFIEKSVARLDQEPKLEALAFQLGKNHFHYKAPPNYYEYIGIQFIQAVRPILKDDWTLEVEKAWQMGRTARSSSPPCLYQVLWAVSVMGLSASRPPLCQQESIRLLDTFIKKMVCYANNLDCFYLEVQVIQEEQEEPSKILSQLLWRLEQLKRKLQRTGQISRCAACPPCQAHPEKPVMAFLRRLLELFQWSCSTGGAHLENVCPSPGPGNSTLIPQTTPSSPKSAVKDHQV